MWARHSGALRDAVAVSPAGSAIRDPAEAASLIVESATYRGGGTVDAADLKSASRKGVWVRIPPSVPAPPEDRATRSGRFPGAASAAAGESLGLTVYVWGRRLFICRGMTLTAALPVQLIF